MVSVGDWRRWGSPAALWQEMKRDVGGDTKSGVCAVCVCVVCMCHVCGVCVYVLGITCCNSRVAGLGSTQKDAQGSWIIKSKKMPENETQKNAAVAWSALNNDKSKSQKTLGKDSPGEPFK